jgi:hypothetical protein
MCLAPKAQHQSQAWWQRAPGFMYQKSISAESAIQVWTNSVPCPIETHFQRLLGGNLNSWGDAPS